MTKYREILRLSSLKISQNAIAQSCGCSKKTVNSILKKARELNIHWPLEDSCTENVLRAKFFSNKKPNDVPRTMPDYEYIRKELLRNGVSKKLLWTEYLEDCRLKGTEPLMYSRFCYYIQEEE